MLLQNILQGIAEVDFNKFHNIDHVIKNDLDTKVVDLNVSLMLPISIASILIVLEQGQNPFQLL